MRPVELISGDIIELVKKTLRVRNRPAFTSASVHRAILYVTAEV